LDVAYIIFGLSLTVSYNKIGYKRSLFIMNGPSDKKFVEEVALKMGIVPAFVEIDRRSAESFLIE